MEIIKQSGISGLKRKQVVQSTSDPFAKVARIEVKNQDRICFRKTVVDNCVNFTKSRLPQRIMYYTNKEWKDFPDRLLVPLIDAFRAGRSMVEVSSLGHCYLVDFLRMSLVNLETGAQQSVAWIDESDQCFFPSHFFYVENEVKQNKSIELKVEIDISKDGSSAWEEGNMVTSKCGFMSPAVKEVIAENGILCLKACHSNACGFDSLCKEMVVELENGGEDYLSVQNAFLKGLSNIISPQSIIGIYRYTPTSFSALSRLQSFEKQIEIMKSYLGDPNIKHGWYGSSRDGILGVLRHGFALKRRPLHGVTYGTGIYFAPEECANVSAKYCDVDENGAQHMVLCRIIMGRVEQIPLGSDWFHPSSQDYDSGVDCLQNPKHYVVWPTHMNTHVHPEYVVSFKLPPIREQVSELKHYNGRSNEVLTTPQVFLPTSAWIPFPLLFAAIQNHIQSQEREVLHHNFNQFKNKKITRQELVLRLRSTVGDELLLSTLRKFHLKPPAISGHVTMGQKNYREAS